MLRCDNRYGWKTCNLVSIGWAKRNSDHLNLMGTLNDFHLVELRISTRDSDSIDICVRMIITSGFGVDIFCSLIFRYCKNCIHRIADEPFKVLFM